MSDPKREDPPLGTESLGPGTDDGRHGGAPPRAAVQGTKAEVSEPVQAALSPRLAAAGFKGFGPVWRRERDGLLDIVAVEAAEISASVVIPEVTLALAAPPADGRAPVGPEGAPAMRRVALSALGPADDTTPAVPPGAPLPEAGDDDATDPEPVLRLEESARAAEAMVDRLARHGFAEFDAWRTREALVEAVEAIEARWRETEATDAAEADFHAVARAWLDEPEGGGPARRLEPGRLVVASHNAGKVREIGELIAPHGLETVSAGELGLPEPEETEETYLGNAALKARAAAGAAGLPALADDSGLSVNLLRGEPGVRSARWAETGAGRDFAAAMRLVAERVEAAGGSFGGVGDNGGAPGRPGGVGAAFHCALALAWPDGHVETVLGTCRGRLCWPPRGERGFGYDPMFVPAGDNHTFAEMAPERKHRLSHRADAFEKLKAMLPG
jgi:XTP/dITP diphosphohydrolase